METHDSMDFGGSDQEERDMHNETNGTKKEDSAGPACQACRRKKAKCSRQTPCSQCVKLGITCLYDKEKGKPGMKAGAIERLTRRLDNLENMFLGQGVLWQQIWDSLQNGAGSRSSPQSAGNLSDCAQQLRDTFDTLSRKRCAEDRSESTQSEATKRQRIEREIQSPITTHPHIENNDDGPLPSDLVDSLVETYFARIHPWIPILHVRQFRQQLLISEQRQKLVTILRAIISICIRFSDDPRLGNAAAKYRLAQRHRQAVILQSMETFSVVNLQALIICAFDIIGSGRGPSAWSIIGSMARTVEQLQLSIEDEDLLSTPNPTQVLVKRMQFLPPCKNWIEREERRRVFWNVFLMDRFCSIATGWNVCLTSADVKRRLPCEGALWEDGVPLHTPTPYFGVSDPPGNSGNQLPSARPETADQASLGGFAYCIEATESLSLVTSFFLQQAVDVAKIHEVQLWLMRFKQLDLRLVQWKIFLPERWREACALNDDGNMDPNLTLAHMTHNTAVVLLHQGIAYPSPEWQSLPIKLPSASSAETCMTAAVEVSIIAEEFLRNSQCLTNSQFAFCLFICGRMLIAHSIYYSIPITQELDSMINNLRKMANRWHGHQYTAGANLASKFALRLHRARQSGEQSFAILQTAYVEDQNDSADGVPSNTQNGVQNGTQLDRNGIEMSQQAIGYGDVLHVEEDQGETPDSITLAFPPLPLAFQAQPPSKNQTAMPSPDMEQLEPTPAPLGHGSHSGSHLGETMNVPHVMPMDGNITLEDLTSFLDYSFLPDQRVSAFQHPVG